MTDMVVLIDTNVILDCLLDREPFVKEADEILKKCYDRKLIGYITAYTVPTIFYLLRKQFSTGERREMLFKLCGFMEIAGINKSHIIEAVTNERFDDLEDCLQTECAKAVGAQYIVTRNTDDFAYASVPAITPEDFLKLF